MVNGKYPETSCGFELPRIILLGAFKGLFLKYISVETLQS